MHTEAKAQGSSTCAFLRQRIAAAGGEGSGVEYSVDVLVVGFCREAFDDLERETHAESDRAGIKGCQGAVVITTSASEAASARSEGEPWDEHTIKCGVSDPFAVHGFLESAVCMGGRMEVFRRGDGAPKELWAVDAGKDEAFGGMLQQGKKVGLPRERGEESHGGGLGPDGMALNEEEERPGAFLVEFCGGLEAGAHEAAKSCFRGGKLCGSKHRRGKMIHFARSCFIA